MTIKVNGVNEPVTAMKTKFNLHSVNLVLFNIFLFLTLLVDWDPAIWSGFSDTQSYLHQSSLPLSSREFYFTPQVGPYSPVPFTVPLIFKIAGSNPIKIILTQKFLYWLSVFFFAYSLILVIRNKFIGLFSILLLYFIMSWWNILGWTIQLLSESLQLSVLLCWMASLILMYRKKNTITFLIHSLFTILLAGTRDQWPYILLLIYFMLTIYFFLFERNFLPKILVLLGLGAGMFFIQQHSADIGHRYRKPLINSIIIRVIKSPEYYNWFREHGMPQSNALFQEYAWTDLQNIEHVKHFFGLYVNPQYATFRHWVDEHGSSTYKFFLLSHPSYFLLLDEKKPNLQFLFSENLYSYTGPPRGYSFYIDPVFPVFHPLFLAFTFIILMYLVVKTRKFKYFIPILLIAVTTLNIFLMYNADAVEVDRHSILTMILVQILGVLSLSIIVDGLWPFQKS